MNMVQQRWTRLRTALWMFSALMAATAAGNAQAQADTYRASLAVMAGPHALEAGQEVTVVIPIQQRLGEDLGVDGKTLDSSSVNLTNAQGEAVEIEARATPLVDSERLGCELRFKLDHKVPAKQEAVYTLTFRAVGAEAMRNSPDLGEKRLEPTTQGGKAWDFDDAQQPDMVKSYHAQTREGVTDDQDQSAGYLVATADGKYSSPVIGRLNGPFDGKKYSRVVIRARHRGPTPAKLLINGKTTPSNAQDEKTLGEDFDLYSVDMTGRKGWGDRVDYLVIRWAYGAKPTAQDQIHLDEVRLLSADHVTLLGRLQPVDGDAAGEDAPPGAVVAPRREQPASRPSAQAFFAKAPDLTDDLPEDGIYPRGQTMGLSLYSVGGGSRPRNKDGERIQQTLTDAQRQAAVRRVAEDGFTMIGPQYELNDTAIADARRAGLKCVYTIRARNAEGEGFHFNKNPRQEVDLEDVRRQVTEQVRAVADQKTIAWWDIKPEERRYWKPVEMSVVRTVADAVHKADPLNRPLFMYEPNHRDAEALAKTMDFQDLSAKGAYTNYTSNKDSRVFVRWSVQQQVQAIKATGRDVTPILLPEMFQQPAEEDLDMIPAWVRHDVYLGLVTGAKGVLIFSMRERPKFTAHDRYYQAYADVAQQLTGKLGLAKLFLFGQRRDQVWPEVTAGPKTVTMPGTGNRPSHIYPSVSWLDVAHPELGRCVVLVNSANKAVTVQLGNLPDAAIEAHELLTDQSRQVTGGGYEITLEPLGVQVWRFKPAE